jgi:hypothetical protein
MSAQLVRPRVAVLWALPVVVATLFATSAATSGAAGSRVVNNASAPNRGNAVIRWNAHAADAGLAACISPASDPPHEARMYAIMHIAVHDALNAIHRRSQPYVFRAHRPGASPRAAIAAAAHDTLVSVIGALPGVVDQGCRDAGIAGVEADYTHELARIPAGTAKRAGILLGRASAARVLRLRAHDGADATPVDPNYPQGTLPGEYRFTPGFDFYFLPHWQDVTPFALKSAAQFRPGPPYPVRSRRYARDLAQIKRLGGDGVTTPSSRTPEETQIALFWLENSPLAWNRIGRTLAIAHHLGLWQSARLFGLLDIAMADGYVGSFETKDHYRFWRPITAIRLAGSDGNPWTTADPTWTPLSPTPPISDHDSAHSVEGAAAAAVFRQFFHRDRMTFTACSLTVPSGTCTDSSPVLRTYSSFSQAAAENGRSRILVGFHFRHAVVAGLRHGRSIGTLAVATRLRPVTSH